MHEDGSYAQRSSDGARVLRPGASESRQDVRRGVETLALRDFANRAAHSLVCHAKVPQRHLLGRQRREFRLRRLGVYSLERLVDADRLLVERASRGVGVEGLVLALAEDFGKVLGEHPTENDVRVRDGQGFAPLR